MSYSHADVGIVRLDVPYRNQIDNYPTLANNWSCCGYTCMIMSLIYNEAIPEKYSEQELINLMNIHCSTNSDGTGFYNWQLSDDFCDKYLSDQDLDVRFIENDFEEKMKEEIEKGNPVIVGTNIFGGYGHVILVVGHTGKNWIVHDPLNKWGQEIEPSDWWSEYSANVEYPMGSFTYLYGVIIESDFNRDFSAKITEKSPSAIIYDNDMAMLWVRVKNTGKQDWERENIHLGYLSTDEASCELRVANHPEEYRWTAPNRVLMEQEKVKSGQEALFGIPISTNGYDENKSISFQMVYDDEEKGCWFGPEISWTIDCRQKTTAHNLINSLTPILQGEKLYYHKGSVHNHTTWSDGNLNVEGICRQAKNVGLEYIVITDHSDYFDGNQRFEWYVDDINQSSEKTGICAVAGIEYSMQYYMGNILEDTTDGRIHIIGMGYNKGGETIIPPFFPWAEHGPKTSIKQLVDWHYENGLPIIVCHPILRGNDTWSNAGLIKRHAFCDPTKISTMEFFDVGMDTTTFESIAGKLLLPVLEDTEAMKLFANYLAPSGVGVSACSDYHGMAPDFRQPLGHALCLDVTEDGTGIIDFGCDAKSDIKIDENLIRVIQSMDRAKTTYVSDFSSVSVNEVVEGFKNKRTIASRYHETFDFIKINNFDWAPGIWQNNVKCIEDVQISFQMQFHNESGVLDKSKEVGIFRNGNLVCDEICFLDSSNKLNFEFIDKNLTNGIHQYYIAITGLEINDRAQERIITSPIYAEVVDEDYSEEELEEIDEQTKVLSIFPDLIHLGDSFYTTAINEGFDKKYDEGKVGSWKFEIENEYLNDTSEILLAMTVRGAEKLDGTYYGNPICVNNFQIGECLVKDGKIENNGKYHFYKIPISELLLGKNILMIRSMSHMIASHGIDFDDFEISDIKLVFVKGNNTESAGILSSYANEIEEFEVSDNTGFSLEEKEEAEGMWEDFQKKGGKLLAKDDPKYKQLREITHPIFSNISMFDRYNLEELKVGIFRSSTLDPIVLPDGTLLIPEGLLNLYNEELPESFLFPIVSSMIQADKGITFEQANRTDWSQVVGTIGIVASSFTGSEIVQAVGVGLMLTAAINLKVNREDYYISDALAYDMLKKMSLDNNDSFSYLDSMVTVQKKNPKNLEIFYLYAPDAQDRLKALQHYHLLKECYQLPIRPEEIDWDKIMEK